MATMDLEPIQVKGKEAFPALTAKPEPRGNSEKSQGHSMPVVAVVPRLEAVAKVAAVVAVTD